MMSLLRCRCSTTLLFILPTVACLAPRLLSRPISFVHLPQQPAQFKPLARARSDRSKPLYLGVDPSDAIQHISHHASHHPTTMESLFSTMISTTADFKTVIPNHSLPPLPETIKSLSLPPNTPDVSNMNDMIIPDMPSMPGGAPRTGNAFLSESFRDLYGAPKDAIFGGPEGRVAADGSVIIPAKELDVIGRYSDLLNRIPLAATIYALVDFFLINAEEDVAISELLSEDELDDERVQAIMDVEGNVVMTRFYGMVITVFLTVLASCLFYHPVPFSEL